MLNFAYLSMFPKIIVTGPQRSGTTITANMIANDIDSHLFVDEGHYQVHNEDEFMRYVTNQHRLVIHAPAMLHLAPIYGHMAQVAVVIMIRPVKDIIASQERIGWVHEHKALQPFIDNGYIEANPTNRQADVKYRWWAENKGSVFNLFEVSFSELKDHRMFVPDDQRVSFRPRQIR